MTRAVAVSMWVAVVAAGGCGGSSSKGSVGGSGGQGSDAAGGAGPVPADAAVPADATVAPDAAPGPADGAPDGGGPEAAPADAAGPVRGTTVVLDECPAGAISGEATAIAAVPGGLLAIVKRPDGTEAVERYLGQRCALAKDATYLPGAAPLVGTQIAADGRGHAYFGATTPGGSNITIELDAKGVVIQRYVQAAASLAVSSDGLALATALVGTPVRSRRSEPGVMFDEDFAHASPAIDYVGAMVFRSGGDLLVGGSRAAGMPFHVFAVSTAGTITATYGNVDPAAPDGLCNVEAVVSCGASGGFCVADFACHEFLVFSATGTHRDGFMLPGGRQPLSLTTLPNGDVYLLRSGGAASGPAVLGIVSAIP